MNRCSTVVLASTILLVAGVPAAVAQTTRPAPRPNIVLVLADDMGFSDIGCYGSEIATPNIDRLAAGGVRFSQFYNCARCSPTRASILTGLYPAMADMSNVADGGHEEDGYRNELSKNAVTIANVLHATGYETYMTGKWHLTVQRWLDSKQDNWPRHRGFDHFWGTIPGAGSYFDPATLVDNDTPISAASDTEDRPFYYTDAIATHASDFIRGHHAEASAKPFFLYVAFTSPHWPLQAPAETIAKYKGKYDAGYAPIRAARFERQKQIGLIDPAWALSEQAWVWANQPNTAWEARCMEVYAAQVDRMDQNVGRIVQTLRDTGDLDHTLILFLSDNGGCAEAMGRQATPERRNLVPIATRPAHEPQRDVYAKHTIDGQPVLDGKRVMPGGADSFISCGEGWANVSNTPFRLYKHFTHEGGISTPLIASWPDGIQPRTAWATEPAHVIDLMPTCVALAGATYPKTFDGQAIKPMKGVSLVPAFTGQPLGRSVPIFWDHEGNRAVRDGKWKLVARGVDGPWQLYDMELDRTEQHNIAAEHQDLVKQMGDQWQHWAETTSVLPRPKKEG